MRGPDFVVSQASALSVLVARLGIQKALESESRGDVETAEIDGSIVTGAHSIPSS